MEVTTVTIRNIPAEVHRALRIQAAKNGRSLQAELWDILNKAVKPEERIKLGDVLEDASRQVSLTEEESALFERDKSPASYVSFD